jgi:hypothetical protein
MLEVSLLLLPLDDRLTKWILFLHNDRIAKRMMMVYVVIQSKELWLLLLPVGLM